MLEVQQKHLEKHHMLDGLEALGCLSPMEINGFLGWNSDWDCTLRAPWGCLRSPFYLETEILSSTVDGQNPVGDDDYPMIYRVLTNRILPSTGFPVFQTHSASLIFAERPMVYRQQVGLQGQSFSICDPQHDGQARPRGNFREVASRTKSRKECLQKIGETNMIN